ncbi:MAG: ABC transporter permease [Mycobacteriales bacterium]
MSAVWAMARNGIARRRLQTSLLTTVVLLSTTTTVLAVALLVASDSPFDHSFARQRGAQVVAAFAKSAPDSTLRATGHRAGVTAAAGPYPQTTVDLTARGLTMPAVVVVGRSGPAGPLDKLTVGRGRWPRGPGEIALSRDMAGDAVGVGDTVTVADQPDAPSLRVVGIAYSVSRSAGAWVTPRQVAALGGQAARQMMYRFSSAGSAARIRADVATVTAGLPHGTYLGSQSYLSIKHDADSGSRPVVPFVVAFSVLGLIVSVIVVANVVSGVVVAGTRDIGVMKALGFTPRQVSAAYVAQVTGPALAGCAAGLVAGNLLAVPVLAQTARAYDVASASNLPWTGDLLVAAVLPVLVAVAGYLPARRAGRMRAIEAMVAGRAPRSGHGYAAHRLLGRSRLPRPISLGLAGPFARPARTAMTLVAVVLGAATVTFAVGLQSSLHRVGGGLTRNGSVQVEVLVPPPGGPPALVGTKAGRIAASRPPGAAPPPPAAPAKDLAPILRAQHGAAHVAGSLDDTVGVTGLVDHVTLTSFQGDAGWEGYPLIHGRWFAGAGEAVVPSRFLRDTGHRLGDTLTVSAHGRQATVRLVGDVFDTDYDGMHLMTGWSTMTALAPAATPGFYQVAVAHGTSAHDYATRAQQAIHAAGAEGDARVRGDSGDSVTIAVLIGLVVLLAVILTAVAALGVFHTVVLTTRERARDIGVYRCLGMTPRQVIATVVTSMGLVGVLGGLVGVPVGYVLHHVVLPVMGNAASTDLPHAFLAVYPPLLLGVLALVGLLIAVLGAVVPARWASRADFAALRTE